MFVLYFQPLHHGEELSIRFWHSPFLISLHSPWDTSDTPSLSPPAPSHPLAPRILTGSKILSPSSFFLHFQLNCLQSSLRASSSPTYAKATYQSLLLSCFGCFKFQWTISSRLEINFCCYLGLLLGLLPSFPSLSALRLDCALSSCPWWLPSMPHGNQSLDSCLSLFLPVSIIVYQAWLRLMEFGPCFQCAARVCHAFLSGRARDGLSCSC